MATYKITAPDGKVYKVTAPEGATQEDALNHFKSQWKSSTPIKTEQPAQAPEAQAMMNKSAPSKFLMGAGNAVINPVMGLGQLTGLVNNDTVKQYQEQYAPLEKDSTAYGAGKLFGDIAIGSKLPGANTFKGATIGAMGLGLAQPADTLQERAMNAGAGGVGSVAGYGAIKGLGRILNPQTGQHAQTLMSEGVTLTPGQILGGRFNTIESKLESLPIVGDAIAYSRRKGYEEFNKAAINRAVAPVGEKIDKIGNEGIAEAGNILSKKYDEVLPKITFKPDTEFANDLQNINTKVAQLPEQEQKAFSNILARINSQHGVSGELNGQAFKDIESEIGLEAKDFSGAASAYEKKLGNYLNELLTAYRDVLPRVNPDYASELSNINKGWANLARIETAGQKEMKEGLFTPNQLGQAVRQQDKTVRNRATARGEALLQDLSQAGSILPSQYPNSGTTGRLALDALVAGTIPVTPTLAAGLGIGATPYLARKTTQAILAKRPELLRKAGRSISKGAPVGARVGGASLLDLYNQQ